MRKNIKQVHIHVPLSLKLQLQKKAKEEGISLNKLCFFYLTQNYCENKKMEAENEPIEKNGKVTTNSRINRRLSDTEWRRVGYAIPAKQKTSGNRNKSRSGK